MIGNYIRVDLCSIPNIFIEKKNLIKVTNYNNKQTS